MLMAAESQTFTAGESASVVKIGTQAGRARATEAALLRAAHNAENSAATPEAKKMGPACAR
eukprot:9108134-Pyramimonas_sp.AAC.1